MRRSWVSLSLSLLGVGAFGLLGAAAACSSFGTDNGSDPDGAAPPVDGAASDAGAARDGAASDAGYCEQHVGATVCTDFDTTDSFAPWMPSVLDGGALKRTAAAFQSPLWSMFSTVDSPSETGGRLYYDLAKDSANVRLGFDVKLTVGSRPMAGDAADHAQVSLAELYCYDDGANGGLWIFYDLVTQTLHGIVNGIEDTALPSLGNEWTRIAIDAALDKQEATVMVGGLSTTLPFRSTCSTGTIFQARIGLSSGTGGVAVGYFDNILLETN